MEVSDRRPGPDVVRAIAMLGVVVMNYHGYLIIRGGSQGDGWADDLFDPWTGPLSTRFAATFVLVAGVGVTLMTRSSLGDPTRVTEMRWRLLRRGLLLYAVGFLFDFVWPGTILPFYGAMFALAAALFTLRIRWLVLIGVGAAVAGAAIRWWRLERELDGIDTTWLTAPGNRSPRGLLLDVFVNGTHPLLPWLAYFTAGIVVGRLLATPWWRPAAIGAGLTLFAVGGVVESAAGTDQRLRVLLSTDPFERGLAYTASALGTALVAFAAIGWLADRYESTAVVDALRRAGQLSLTIYVLHALVFNFVVDTLGWVEPTGLDTALAFAFAFWAAGVAAAVAWQHRFGRGPAEHLYRALTA
jgi:uncharacterized protein